MTPHSQKSETLTKPSRHNSRASTSVKIEICMESEILNIMADQKSPRPRRFLHRNESPQDMLFQTFVFVLRCSRQCSNVPKDGDTKASDTQRMLKMPKGGAAERLIAHPQLVKTCYALPTIAPGGKGEKRAR